MLKMKLGFGSGHPNALIQVREPTWSSVLLSWACAKPLSARGTTELRERQDLRGYPASSGYELTTLLSQGQDCSLSYTAAVP